VVRVINPRVSEWTTLRVLDWTTQRFSEAKLDTPRLDAQVLIAHALACTRVQLYMAFDKPLAASELTSIRELIKRRLAGQPVAYLVGAQEFWSTSIEVDAAVLIPRRDSETLVEQALELVPQRDVALRVLDLCTGSGVLAVILARELPAATVVATDLSIQALAVARRNAERLGVASRVEFLHGDLFAAVPGRSADAAAFDLIISNPPYICSGELAHLSPEVRAEPRLALDGGADGLAVLRPLIAGMAAHLASGGFALVEHGFDQEASVAALFAETGQFTPAICRRDLAGQPRITWARRS
jgi:release factor glutamine methyltransferase